MTDGDSLTGAQRPRLLDLFCCEGGAAMGYFHAGFEVVGVDVVYERRYPFEFHQADAIEYVREHGHEFDVIHASPPCQHASAGTRALRAQGRSKHPHLIEPTREALIATGKPYVIENVAGSALLNPLVLCGTEFGLWARDQDGVMLELRRHRHFESNVLLMRAGGCQHGRYSKHVGGSYGGARRDRLEAKLVRRGGYVPTKVVQADLLGLASTWMSEHGMHQCVPPRYTWHIGRQLMAAVKASRAA